jgi:hypothetical protein
MLRWNPPLFKYTRTIADADAEEAKALKRFNESRAQSRELIELTATAARIAESVKRMSQELRHLP